MFSSWPPRIVYLIIAGLILMLTARFTRPGLEKSLAETIIPGFGPPRSLWQAWKLFCSFFWEQVLLVGVVVACAVRLAFGQWSFVDLAIALVIAAVFPFQEYFSHMYLLHRAPWTFRGRRMESVASLVHRVHHRDPWNMKRAVNPPIAIVLYAVGLPIVFFPWLPPPQAMTGVAASWLVLLAYEWIHLLIHTSHVPKNWLYKRIWRNHRLHHFKNEHYWYNVSTIGVDVLLGTHPSPGEVPTSSTCLTLGQEAVVECREVVESRAPEDEPAEQLCDDSGVAQPGLRDAELASGRSERHF